jgi:hypothetical protein
MNLPREISMTRALCAYVKQYGCDFYFAGNREPAAMLLSEQAFLPAIAMQADLAARSALGAPLGIKFEANEISFLGVAVEVQPLTGDEASMLRIAFFTKAMHEIFGISSDVKQIECAPVFEAYRDGLLSYIETNGGHKWPIATVSK